MARPQEDNRPNGEGNSRRYLDFGQESPNKNMEYTGLLATLNNFDKNFARDTIAKLLKNIICKENLRLTRQTQKRQPSRLAKRIREIRKALNGERQETVLIESETKEIWEFKIRHWTRWWHQRPRHKVRGT